MRGLRTGFAESGGGGSTFRAKPGGSSTLDPNRPKWNDRPPRKLLIISPKNTIFHYANNLFLLVFIGVNGVFQFVTVSQQSFQLARPVEHYNTSLVLSYGHPARHPAGGRA